MLSPSLEPCAYQISSHLGQHRCLPVHVRNYQGLPAHLRGACFGMLAQSQENGRKSQAKTNYRKTSRSHTTGTSTPRSTSPTQRSFLLQQRKQRRPARRRRHRSTSSAPLLCTESLVSLLPAQRIRSMHGQKERRLVLKG
jgi:hypothetical protein